MGAAGILAAVAITVPVGRASAATLTASEPSLVSARLVGSAVQDNVAVGPTFIGVTFNGGATVITGQGAAGSTIAPL